MNFDLLSYSSRFEQVCWQKFGMKYDFAKMEKRCEPLRNGSRWLVSKDVAFLFDSKQTLLSRYWRQPDIKRLEKVLSRSRIFLGPIPKQNIELVRKLLPAFHNIGHISIILRFVHPERFAIFSAPLTHLLQVQGRDAVGLYIAYCEELLRWKEHFKLNSVAQTEMALWVFDQAIQKADNPARADQLRQEFDGDLWIQRRRATWVLRPLLENNGTLGIAKILTGEYPRLAGKLVAEEYERFLRDASHKFYRQDLPLTRGAAQHLLDRLAQDGHISITDKVDLYRVWELRNQVVHPDESPTVAEIEWMTDQVERICLPWKLDTLTRSVRKRPLQ